MTKELLQQALDALIPLATAHFNRDRAQLDDTEVLAAEVAVEALREALAQPVQPPWDSARQLLSRCETEMRYAGWDVHVADNPQRIELYTDVVGFLGGFKLAHIPADKATCQTCEALARTVMLDQTSHDTKRIWVQLTEDEATALWEATHNDDSWELIKRVEAKLREKNNDKPRN